MDNRGREIGEPKGVDQNSIKLAPSSVRGSLLVAPSIAKVGIRMVKKLSGVEEVLKFIGDA